MPDQFSSQQVGLSDPAESATPITPSTTALSTPSRALYVGTAGDLIVTMVGGASVTLTSVAAGVIYPLRVTHVLPATTAGGIVALW